MSSWWLSLVPTLLCSLVIAWGVRSWAWRHAFLDQPGDQPHKGHNQTVAYGGGIAIMAALALGCGIALLTGDLPLALLARQWPLALATLALFLLGLYDDHQPLPARLKLLLQILVVVAAICLTGLRVYTLNFFPPLAILAAVIWCLAVTNAYNLLDHADGLSSTVAIITCMIFLIAALLGDQLALGLQSALLGVALLGFLCWNLPPARLYMGDAGSLPLGFLLGVGALQVTFWPSTTDSSHLAVLTPLLLTAIPLYDATVVACKRLRHRRPLLVGDRNHISHRLTRLGLGPRSSLLAVAALQTALAGSALLLRRLTWPYDALVLAQALCIVTVAILLEANRDRHRDPDWEPDGAGGSVDG